VQAEGVETWVVGIVRRISIFLSEDSGANRRRSRGSGATANFRAKLRGGFRGERDGGDENGSGGHRDVKRVRDRVRASK
jgi:hypothetical protein